jgi:hypothetical protein
VAVAAAPAGGPWSAVRVLVAGAAGAVAGLAAVRAARRAGGTPLPD